MEKHPTKAGVGTPERPESKRVPDAVLIKRPATADEGAKVTASPEVQGDKALMIIDVMHVAPVKVMLIEGTPLNKEDCPTLVYVEGAVSNDLMTLELAKRKFAVKKDGTVIFNQRGFDDVPGQDFDLLDISKLIAHNHGKKVVDDNPKEK